MRSGYLRLGRASPGVCAARCGDRSGRPRRAAAIAAARYIVEIASIVEPVQIELINGTFLVGTRPAEYGYGAGMSWRPAGW